MDIFDILHADHENVARLFSRIESLSPRATKTRQATFMHLKKELDKHSRAEEKVFYPELKKRDQSHFGALEATEEHHVLDLLLKELDAMPDKDSEQWLAKLNVLKENVEHHVEEEEEELFRQAREFMSEDEAVSLGEKFTGKKRLLH